MCTEKVVEKITQPVSQGLSFQDRLLVSCACEAVTFTYVLRSRRHQPVQAFQIHLRENETHAVFRTLHNHRLL